ncbi:ribose-phosphate diphosphokinase [Salsipaludibacter albus]|uniref:ribose-phosphate diphosphokinase n=1 Tax=Salsipaludibacter albus TaxID=2849650 RepID=UPI001EE40117|nr:ribose-phosphate diphosphokinase [Salsipaludibacter albus]MBY5161940.1 ribose-phosphate diphosphokinase [Salsipaludibacter albus]
MEVVTRKRMMIFSGSSNPELAREVADHLGMRIGKVRLETFANGELYARYEESVRGADAFVLQSHLTVPDGPSINDFIMEQLIMIDALKRASAKRIVAVMPFFGYSRSDKKTLAREAIAARLMADMFRSAGVDRLMSVDLHTGQIQGFLDDPFDHLTAMPLLEGWIARNTDPVHRVIVSPDAGRVRLTEKFASHLGCSMAIMQKHRDPTQSNVSETREVIGEVDGMDCVIVDDMIDTAGTICGAATMLKERGARRVFALATHPVLSGPAKERLDEADIEAVVVTNTIPIPEQRRPHQLVVLSIAPIVASALRAVFEDASVSELFAGENM